MVKSISEVKLAKQTLIVVGGGLAGSEAVWQAAERGIKVLLYEMRPTRPTPAHTTDRLSELVCSNSLGSTAPDRAPGLLKAEIEQLGSFILQCANETAVPAGSALAVDREKFAELVTRRLQAHPNIQIIREEVTRIPDEPCIIASGPLTSESLATDIARLMGSQHLYFYDALAPIVEADTIDRNIVFKASRHDKGDDEGGDYLNCPLNKDDYTLFVNELLRAGRIPLREFEEDIKTGVKAGPDKFFEGCLPIEIIAERGEQSLAFGPMRPIGLTDPRTGRWPYAVAQLRQDNLAGSLYNIVGFQTNLTWLEQKRVLRLIPGLQNAEFARYGQMHRNTFINSPTLLEPTMQTRQRPDLFFAGQITGVEGYMGNAASGLVAGINASRFLQGQPPLIFPQTTMLGALSWYVTHAEPKTFQPMKANFRLMPPLENSPRGRRDRAKLYTARALADLQTFIGLTPLSLPQHS
ncbi:MAG: methylenetetrahydrofolate--tRNA-(uracil(54)-C(5))-methyltransferase (FADH(2)-oxidizing) TrmFO [Chloroflexi bacterium]|nr:methylenetetrahydrofolate--tRNA-(uracil(54)-C(5))-methyltransferase (FADH(2)-oxidizing) TrmFO [Chloroflexota bacterium]